MDFENKEVMNDCQETITAESMLLGKKWDYRFVCDYLDKNERYRLAQTIESKIQELFPDTVIREYGCQKIIGDDQELNNFVRSPEINQMAAGMLVKFAPDYLLLRKKPRELFFVDVKHSTSPIWSSSRIKKIRDLNYDKTLEISDIGVIAREALLSYRRFYPNSIVLMASPYNAKVLMAQFANNIKCLYCYHSPGKEYSCQNCPAKNGSFFDIERATNSKGSQTPMTNVGLRSFNPADIFFRELGIKIDLDELNNLINIIKQEEIVIDKDVFDNLSNHAKWEINKSGCDWVSYELYAKEGNDFLHISKDCYLLNVREGLVHKFSSLCEAKISGRNKICKYCGKKYC